MAEQFGAGAFIFGLVAFFVGIGLCIAIFMIEHRLSRLQKIAQQQLELLRSRLPNP